MSQDLELIPADLISTTRAAELLGYRHACGIRYHIRKAHLKAYKNRSGDLFVSESEARRVLGQRLTVVN